MIVPIVPTSPSMICPCANAEPVPRSCSVSDRIIVVRIRGRFHSAYPISPTISGTIVSTQVATMVRADFFSPATSVRAARPLAPGARERRIGLILP